MPRKESPLLGLGWNQTKITILGNVSRGATICQSFYTRF